MTKLTGEEFIRVFEKYCPLWLAEKGDPVGLHIGSLKKPIHRVLVTLDVRPEVVEEAIEKQIDLIIAKHPPIFRPVERLLTDQPQEKMYAALLQANIAVYAAHTNLDIIENGVNDWLCAALDIKVDDWLSHTHTIPAKKLVVYVPVEAVETVRSALTQAGAGKIGANYQDCSYSIKGEGRFRPVNEAKPTIGQLGELEIVEEERIEVLFYKQHEQAIVSALLQAHPYEEPVYDIYQIDNFAHTYGLGRIGNLAQPITLGNFIQQVKTVFQLEGLRFVARDENQLVQRIAVCGGSGQKFYPDALRKNADVYLTGDVYYHTAHDMLADNLAVIDPGHHIESICIPRLTTLLNNWKQENNWELDILPSETDTNPFRFC